MAIKKSVWDMILKMVIAVASAIAGHAEKHRKHWLFARPYGIISHREPGGADRKNSVYFTCASEQLQQKQAVCVF